MNIHIVLVLTLVWQIEGRGIYETNSLKESNGFNANDYLKRFGYMTDSSGSSTGQSSSPVDLQQAIRKFQSWNSLPMTGELDEGTMGLMNTPRCGVKDPDIPQGMSRSFVLGPKWSKKSLTYRIVNTTPDVSSQNTVRSEIRRAFSFWSDVALLEFTETSGPADIVISFESGDHGDGSPFDGEGGVLAHATFPEDGSCHFDEGENWVVNASGSDLFIIAAHEFGHILGLDHSNTRSALMYPFYGGYVPNYTIDPDDRAAIIAHYGKRESSNPNPTEPTGPMVENSAQSSGVNVLICWFVAFVISIQLAFVLGNIPT